jgi:hypothetical protein
MSRPGSRTSAALRACWRSEAQKVLPEEPAGALKHKKCRPKSLLAL